MGENGAHCWRIDYFSFFYFREPKNTRRGDIFPGLLLTPGFAPSFRKRRAAEEEKNERAPAIRREEEY